MIAVFTDYNNACKFVPNCLKSQVSNQVSPKVADVDYLIDVPILADEAYTVRDTLKQEAGGALRVSWKLLKATSILETQGSLYVEPAGDGAMLRYTNLVKPSSGAAVILKGVALSQMKKTIDAIVDQVEQLKATPGALQPKLDKLDAALGGKN